MRTQEGGSATAQEEAQSREQYFFFRAQMETALRDLLAAENRLRWLMGWSPTDGELLRPIDRPTLARVEFEWQAVTLGSVGAQCRTAAAAVAGQASGNRIDRGPQPAAAATGYRGPLSLAGNG